MEVGIIGLHPSTEFLRVALEKCTLDKIDMMNSFPVYIVMYRISVIHLIDYV